METPVYDAQVALECQNRLGEGILWDDHTKTLYWVDIERAEIHSWDFAEHKVDKFKEPYISALAPRKSKPGLVAAFKSSVVLLDGSTVQETLVDLPFPEDVRFNDGACDAAGRFFIGSMSIHHELGHGGLWRVDSDGATRILEGVGTSNGIDWSPDNKRMYYVDSEIGTVEVFDYDLESGIPSNRRVFVTCPPVLGSQDKRDALGAFDGLIVDGVGNVWVARWGDSRVMVYSPDGSVVAHIRTPGALSPTIPCFGGEDLNTLYIATANADLAGQGELQAQYPNSGDVYSLDCGPGSEGRKALGPQWRGRVRHRFSG